VRDDLPLCEQIIQERTVLLHPLFLIGVHGLQKIHPGRKVLAEVVLHRSLLDEHGISPSMSAGLAPPRFDKSIGDAHLLLNAIGEY
jgi:hypothetical protein